MRIIAYTDGATINKEQINGLWQGPSGLGVAFFTEDRKYEDNFDPFHTMCIPLQFDTTNNVAEYAAVIEAIEYFLLEVEGDELEIRSDSLLVVSQIKGDWETKAKTLQGWQKRARHLIAMLDSIDIPVTLIHIPREENKLADVLSKEAAGLARDTVR